MFRKMKKELREMPEKATVEMFEKASNGILGVLGDDGYPYTVPLSFAYVDGKIYFHGATEGHKVAAIRSNPKASFCVVERDEVKPSQFTTKFKSGIAFGTCRIVETKEEKVYGCQKIIAKYSEGYEEKGGKYMNKAWDNFLVFVMDVKHMTGKENPII